MRKPHSPFLASIYEQMLMLRYAIEPPRVSWRVFYL